MSLGPYASFILTSYALVAIVVIALIVWVALDHRRQQRILRDLDMNGVTRRSSSSGKPS